MLCENPNITVDVPAGAWISGLPVHLPILTVIDCARDHFSDDQFGGRFESHLLETPSPRMGKAYEIRYQSNSNHSVALF